MAEVLATQSYLGMQMARDDSTTAPLPNPPFVFPISADNAGEVPLHGRSSSNLLVTGSRRPASRSRPQRLSFDALPAFEFSPSSPSALDRPPSPPRSPIRKTPPPHHHHGGHRRNGSEFVGGDISNGGPVLVSSSPTRSEHSKSHRGDGGGYTDDAAFDGQASLATSYIPCDESLHSHCDIRPATARRGHAHRRSGAISSHDVSTILRPSTEPKGGSAPTTPSDASFRDLSSPLETPNFQPVDTSSAPSTLRTQSEHIGRSEQTSIRAVEFSDVLEYIPRPLSTISSETSSSMSTVRASHSVTNSITSFISGGPSSPPPAIATRFPPGQAWEHDHRRERPSTAGVPGLSSIGASDWDPSETESPIRRPSTAPTGWPPDSSGQTTDAAAPKIMPSTIDQSTDKSPSDPNTLECKLNATSIASATPKLQQLRRRPGPSPNSTPRRPKTSPEPKITKRQRKRKSFADLLPRKANQDKQRHDFLGGRAPTPPLRNPSMDGELSLDDIDFDNDTIFVTESTAPGAARCDNLHPDFHPQTTRELSPIADDHSASILDIDAALRSLDARSIGPAFEDVVGVGLSTKRRMHSSGATGGFAGPGMHYHRRAESAPELDPIDRSRFVFPRLGSDPAMAIEEEEEDEEEANRETECATVQKGLGVNIVEAASVDDEPILRPRRRTKTKGQLKPENSQQHLEGESGPVEIVSADEEPRFSVITKSSDESTITPALSHDPLERRPVSAPFELVMPTPALTFGTSQTPSVVSSPDFSKISFDVPRIHTANSSITDRATLNSNRTGENSMGLHSSVDDVPSLTSSASTVSARQPRVSSSANTFSSAERSASLSAAVPPRTRPVSAGKRASLASLTRLVGNSYNRSKLNIEMSAPLDSDESNDKKKGHRISRLMKFWKSKEKRSAS